MFNALQEIKRIDSLEFKSSEKQQQIIDLGRLIYKEFKNSHAGFRLRLGKRLPFYCKNKHGLGDVYYCSSDSVFFTADNVDHSFGKLFSFAMYLGDSNPREHNEICDALASKTTGVYVQLDTGNINRFPKQLNQSQIYPFKFLGIANPIEYDA